MTNRIFSVKNEDYDGKIFKVFYILGFKIKFFSMKETLKTQVIRIDRLREAFCNSIVTLLCEINNGSELICIKSGNMVFILSKYFFNCDKQFIFDFLSYNFLISKQSPVITSLNKDCPLYKEHIEKLKAMGGG